MQIRPLTNLTFFHDKISLKILGREGEKLNLGKAMDNGLLAIIIVNGKKKPSNHFNEY